MASIFKLFRILPLPAGGGTFLEWKLHPSFPAALPMTYTCQVSRTGSSQNDGWTDLPNVLVGDARSAVYSNVDTTQRIASLADRVFYRIKVATNDGQIEYSQAKPPYCDLPRQDRLHATYIIRDQLQRMRVGAGTCGYLFKRKYWGTRCTNPYCLDKDTYEVAGRRCSVCLNTGWVGGYASPIPYWIDFSDNQTEKISTGPAGQGFVDVAKVRVVLCPSVQTADIFLDPATDSRWWIDSLDVVSQIRNFEILGDLVVKQIDPTSILSLLDASHAG